MLKKYGYMIPLIFILPLGKINSVGIYTVDQTNALNSILAGTSEKKTTSNPITSKFSEKIEPQKTTDLLTATADPEAKKVTIQLQKTSPVVEKTPETPAPIKQNDAPTPPEAPIASTKRIVRGSPTKIATPIAEVDSSQKSVQNTNAAQSPASSAKPADTNVVQRPISSTNPADANVIESSLLSTKPADTIVLKARKIKTQAI